MARKNPFANLMDDPASEEGRPALDYTIKGASRSIINSIDELADRADKLLEGETVIELDPDSLDASFVRDRLDDDGEEFNDLLEAIRERGQDSPVLVRPHPSKPGRYMVVFGHRRVKVAKMLGRKIRAVVKDLKDRDHVIAQGQENSARANLSFIEKAQFAGRLAGLQYDNDNSVVMTALAIDRATLSKMLSVAGIPAAVLTAIGAAKSVGRDRWYELKLLLEKPANLERALALVEEEGFGAASSDERFNLLVGRLKSAAKKAKPMAAERKWAAQDRSVSAEMKASGKNFLLSLKGKQAEVLGFGEFLSESLPELYAAYRSRSNNT